MTRTIKTAAGEFREIRLSIRMPKPLWRALNEIASAMNDTRIPVRCAVFGDESPAIASLVRALIMESTADQLDTIIVERPGPEMPRTSVRQLVEMYIRAGYGQDSPAAAPPDAPTDAPDVDGDGSVDPDSGDGLESI